MCCNLRHWEVRLQCFAFVSMRASQSHEQTWFFEAREIWHE